MVKYYIPNSLSEVDIPICTIEMMFRLRKGKISSSEKVLRHF